MTPNERQQLKSDLRIVSAYYGLSTESEKMAYIAAEDCERARIIYRNIRISIEEETR